MLKYITMLQTISLDPQTIIVKAKKESDLLEIINYITRKDKQKTVDAFLNFASKNRKIEKEFKFNREECYE